MFFLFRITNFAQKSDIPVIGKQMPDFVLSDIKRFGEQVINNKTFKGKWLFMDFWTITCKACIASFPKINNIQRDFSEKLNYLMIGKNDSKFNNGIEKFYERIKISQKLNMIASFDSVLMDKWEIGSVPHIYIIDPEGVLRYVTDGRNMTKDKIEKLIKGESVAFYEKDKTRFDWNPLGVDTLSGVCYSILSSWNGEKQQSGYPLGIYSKTRQLWKNDWRVAMQPLIYLYKTAYFGTALWLPNDKLYSDYYPQPVLEIKDSSLFQYDFTEILGKGTYNYSMRLPEERITEESLKRRMQNDLKMFFNYDAFIEERECAVVSLVSLPGRDKKRLTAKFSKCNPGNEPSLSSVGFSGNNISIDDFIWLSTQLLKNYYDIAFVNKTEITSNITIKLEADMSDIGAINKSLLAYGLKFVNEKKKMKALVIKDNQSPQ